MSDDDRLGSLAQSARGTSLNRARVILILIGVLTMLFNLFMFFNVANEAKQAIDQERKKLPPGMVIDAQTEKEAQETLVRFGQVIYGALIGMGATFIVLGILVYKAPVACTATGLVLYVAANAIFAAIDPIMIVHGIIIKIIIIVGLFKALQAALAYQREAHNEREEFLDRSEEPEAPIE